MAKAKNHKLNKFLIFPLEGKSCNHASPQNTEKIDKTGNKAFVDLKYFTILKYFSVSHKNLRQYVCMLIYKHTYLRWFVGKAVRAAREAVTIGGRSLIFFRHSSDFLPTTQCCDALSSRQSFDTVTLWQENKKRELRPLVVRGNGDFAWNNECTYLHTYVAYRQINNYNGYFHICLHAHIIIHILTYICIRIFATAWSFLMGLCQARGVQNQTQKSDWTEAVH